MRTDRSEICPPHAEPAVGGRLEHEANPSRVVVGYCGICKEWYAYRAEREVQRCPLCGYRPGDC
jgi:hypothetical protein